MQGGVAIRGTRSRGAHSRSDKHAAASKLCNSVQLLARRGRVSAPFGGGFEPGPRDESVSRYQALAHQEIDSGPKR